MEIVRSYRENLKGFNITYKETDLFIKAESVLKKETFSSLIKHRAVIEKYISTFPEFYTSLKPLPLKEEDEEIITMMKEAGIAAEVGPFAAVAGAIAEKVAFDLNEFSEEVTVENGGDVFLTGKKDKIVKVFSKNSVNFALKIDSTDLPVAVCSSSATIGHSISLGKAELVTVISRNGAMADAFATSICNCLKNESDIEPTINKFKNKKIIEGALIVFKDKIAGWGNLNIIKIEE